MSLTAQELIDFETDIANRFNNAEIPFPIHLSRGNEQFLIDIFSNFNQEKDFCFSTWRCHYHALLAGIPAEEVRRQIMCGRSMTVCSPEHRFFASAIVGGCIPIAVGVAWQIKQRGENERVFLFIGDMAAQSGIAHECIKYARLNQLPLVVVVEDNGKSVCSDTKEVWGGQGTLGWEPDYYYQWNLAEHYPHSGAGRRIQF